MRCRKHPTDHSSGVGFCASCLRERLVAVLAAQAQAQARQAIEDSRKSDTQSPPQAFPRSVSPYVSRRKSDTANWSIPNRRSQLNLGLTDQRFYRTPQVGPTGEIVLTSSSVRRRKNVKFSFLSSLFRSKSDKTGLNAGVTLSEPCYGPSFPASSSSPSWLSNVLAGRRKKQLTFFTDDSSSGRPPRPRRDRDRGLSPARCDDEECCYGSSGYSSESSQEGYKQTPSRAARPSRRRGGGRRRYSRNIAGLAFCLSPLVRASPNQHWNQKTMPPETVITGEMRVQAKPHLSSAASYCANRSRKLADFGRFNQTY